ncbi:MAG: hypothetical protein MUF44_01860 [Hydrogenophaga sp.]|jgi:hypothetical protein|nr:hypothetical protein [Hydrogenophaga sp.]
MLPNPLKIIPYTSLGDVRFGMTPQEVHAKWGQPSETGKNYQKKQVDYYEYINVAYSLGDNSQVIHFGGGRKAFGVEIQGVRLFDNPPKTVLEKILTLEKKPFLFLKNVLVLFDLGITLSGFLDDEEDDLAFSMFPEGGMDRHLSLMKPFKM